ncbi:MAG: hypothetical protein DMD96_19110 [Candidatus Rokuibacteriota bacterium]|nr:MAG: hypothetical protein DMD96_19110 [Candidatus Rokubacteria bacterium]
MKYAVVIALAMLFATPAWAQQVEIKKPSPPPAREERDVIPPGLQDETRPGDADHYPRGGQVQHDPAFIGPMSKRRETATSTGRFGVAGWVSPNTPVGSPNSGWNEVSGYFALGFSITWDGPPPVRRTAPAAP